MKLLHALPFLCLLSLLACRSGDHLVEEDAPPSTVMNVQFSSPREQTLPVGSAQLIRSDWDNDGDIELLVPVPQSSEGSGTTDDGRIQAFTLQAQSSEWLQADNQSSWNPGKPRWHQSFVIEDFDQDGDNDLLLTQSGSVYLQLLKGPNWLDDNSTLIVGLTPISLQAGDWNNDGRKDIAVANRGMDSISTLLNNGNDNFTTAATLDTADFPQQLMQGDWNGDNVTDLASISVGENLLQLWKGKGDGTFEKTSELDTPSSPQQLEVADFDCDGRQDLAVSSRSAEVLRIWYGDGSGNFGNQFDLPAGRGPSSFDVADFNEDGVLDFVISNRFVVAFASVTTLTGDMALVLSNGSPNRGTAAYKSPELFAATHHLQGDTPGDVIIEDVDGNGKLDLMVALPQQAKVALFDGKEFGGRPTCP
ncbi:MAG: VCBS repeat-containing protein [SAR324 cluster bacterium]|nr:VCBS repeat-containing protein [SAR324 cluster bacterium]